MATNNNANGSSKVTIFTSSGTWNKDPRTSLVHIFLVGAASGGGSGRQGLTTLAGGGSGSTGSSNGHYISIGDYYDNSISVTIGSGGAGGISQASISSDGNPGSLGGNVFFGTQFGIAPISTNQGKAGSTASVTGGLINLRFCNIGGQVGNSTGGSGTLTNGTSPSVVAIGFSMVSSGGGGGGGADTTTARSGGNGGNIVNRAISPVTILSGGSGGIETGTINGTDGNSATQPQNAVGTFGTGGGGGGGQKTGLVAGNGGNGGIPGGGGGGGGGSINGTISGAGGNGARGEIWVMEIF